MEASKTVIADAHSSACEPPAALVNELVAELERAIRQRDEFQRTGISTASHGGSHDTCIGVILRKYLPELKSLGVTKPDGTPAAAWRLKGEADPHGNSYECERAALTLGKLTDDELANAAFMNYDHRPPLQDVVDGKAHMPIVYMTAVKERIRWLSRALVKAQGETAASHGYVVRKKRVSVFLQVWQADVEWVQNPNHATHFTRQEDAERACASFGEEVVPAHKAMVF
jgi:hypothetical protein